MNSGVRHLWVETLSGRTAVWMSFAAMWRPTVIYCTARTSRGDAVLRLAQRLLGSRLSVEVRELDMGVTDETGHALYRQHEIMLARLSRSVIPDDPRYRWLPAGARIHGDLWCRVLASNVHDRWHLAIAFLVWVENLYRIGVLAVPPGGVTALIPGGWLARHLAREFCARRASPIAVDVLPHVASWFLYYPLPLYPLIGAARLALLARQHPPRAGVDPDAVAAGTFLAQYNAHALDSHLQRANFLWHQSSGLESRRVIVLFNRTDAPLDSHARQLVDRMGFGWVEDMAQVYSAENSARTFVSVLAELLTVLPIRWSPVDIARWAVLAYISLRVASCRKLFRRYNVRACALSWNFFTETGIIALSAQYEHAVYVRWNKSLHGPFQNIFHRGMAHIAFVWGEYDRAFLRAHDFRCPLFLTSGVVGGDDADEEIQRAVLAMRKSMTPQVSFVIGLFDTSYDRKLYNSEAHVLCYYRQMLGAIRAHSHWGCIIKTKTTVYDDLPLAEGVQNIVSELQNEGRCIVLDGWQAASSLTMAVDAVVCCNINMAGHLVAMHGVPALHLDYSGQYYINWYDHPAASKCFFTDAAAVVSALEAIERGDRSWGDASSWSDLLDQFQDGQGPRRIGEALRFYMDQVSAGASVDRALERLADWYGERYGSRSVCRDENGSRSDVDAWFAESHNKFYADRPRPFPNAHKSGAPVCGT
jgi:hypothetical protein